MKKVGLLFTHPPYGDVSSYEGLRIAIGLASMGCDENLGLIFFDEALFCLTKNHNPSIIKVSDIKDLLNPVLSMDAKVFACKSCMERYGIREEDLEPSVDVILINDVVRTMEEYDTLLRF